MKKAKSRSKNAASQKKNVSSDHINLVIDHSKTVSEISKENQSRFYGMSGSIRQLMAVYNTVLDSRNGLTDANKRAIDLAAASLENSIDQKIDSMNEFLSSALDKARSKKRRK